MIADCGLRIAVNAPRSAVSSVSTRNPQSAIRNLRFSVLAHTDDDLPKLLAARQALDGLGPSLDVVNGVDRRQQASLAQMLRDRVHLIVIAHRRAHQGPLVPEHSANVRLDEWPGRRSAGDEAAATAERQQRLPPRVLADVVDDDVDTALAGARADFPGDILRSVIERLIRAKCLGPRELFVVAGGDPRLRPDGLRDLHRGQRDTSANTPNENVLTALHTGARDDHAPRGDRRQREGGGGIPWNGVRHDADVHRGNDDVVSDRSGQVLAKQLVLDAERVLAFQTKLAGAVGDPGIDDHAVAGAYPAHRRSDLIDDSGAVASHDPGWCDHDAREALDNEQVQVIERGRTNADAHVVRCSKLRGRDVCSILQLLQPAVGGDRQCSHARDSGLYFRQNPIPARDGEQRKQRLIDHCLMTAIQVPALGESIVEGTIARWLKAEGDAVQKGDALVELETDKINVEVPAPASGVLVKRLKNDGDVVKVGETLGELDEAAVPAATGASSAKGAEAGGAEGAGEAEGAGGAESAKGAKIPSPASAETKTSPSVRRVAAET